MTLTMLNNRSCEEITIDSPYSNIGGTCSLTSQSATTFDYECLSSGGDTTHFVCTGAYCALTTADKSGWYVYDSSCTASDIRTVMDVSTSPTRNYLSSDPIARGSRRRRNGNAFAVVDDGGVTVANGTLAQERAGAVDACLSAGTCYNLTIDASGTSLSHIAFQLPFAKRTRDVCRRLGRHVILCVDRLLCGRVEPSPSPPPTSPPTGFTYPAPTVSPTPVPTQLPVPRVPTALPGDPTALLACVTAARPIPTARPLLHLRCCPSQHRRRCPF